MRKFRKKPVVIEAVQLFLHNSGDVAEWCGGTSWSRPPMRKVTGLTITTLEGDMHAAYGDWVIQGVAGEFYPCKAPIFEASYEPVGEDDDGSPE